jgi:transposase
MRIDEDTRGHVRYLYFKQEYSIRAINRKLGISRKSIRNILADKPQRGKRTKESKLDSFKDEIKTILKDKPRISTVLLFEMLREKGYDGGRTIVYDYISHLKRQEKPAYFHIEILPGEQAQVDWGHCGTINCGLHQRKLYVFCMTLSYSRYLYIEFTVSMDMETFLAAHIHAFHFYGGIPKGILYDNLKSVVSRRVKQEIIFNAHYMDFARFYDFSPLVCNIRKPHEKA